MCNSTLSRKLSFSVVNMIAWVHVGHCRVYLDCLQDVLSQGTTLTMARGTAEFWQRYILSLDNYQETLKELRC